MTKVIEQNVYRNLEIENIEGTVNIRSDYKFDKGYLIHKENAREVALAISPLKEGEQIIMVGNGTPLGNALKRIEDFEKEKVEFAVGFAKFVRMKDRIYNSTANYWINTKNMDMKLDSELILIYLKTLSNGK